MIEITQWAWVFEYRDVLVKIGVLMMVQRLAFRLGLEGNGNRGSDDYRAFCVGWGFASIASGIGRRCFFKIAVLAIESHTRGEIRVHYERMKEQEYTDGLTEHERGWSRDMDAYMRFLPLRSLTGIANIK